MDKHGCVSRLKAMALELGHTPSRDEVRAKDPDLERLIRRTFGGHAQAVRAAGLDPVRVNKKEQLEKLFKASIEEQLKRFAKEKRKLGVIELGQDFRTLFIGDAHFPFVNPAVLNAIYDRVEQAEKEGKPFTHIVQGGDLYDMMAQGKFPKSLHIYNPKEEIELGQKMAQEMWATLRKLAPKALCFQILGNHDIRPLKRILEHYPEGEIFFSIDRFFQFEGVTTLMDAREELVFKLPGGDLIAVHHGFASRLGQHRDHFLVNTVVFHTHRAGIVYRNMGFGRGVQYEANGGYVADPESKALSYTQTRTTHWTNSWLEIDPHGPRVITL